jgi:hypothetical protein
MGVLRVASSHPDTFDRLQNTSHNVGSAPAFGPNLSSQEGSFEQTEYDSQQVLKGSVLLLSKRHETMAEECANRTCSDPIDCRMHERSPPEALPT